MNGINNVTKEYVESLIQEYIREIQTNLETDLIDGDYEDLEEITEYEWRMCNDGAYLSEATYSVDAVEVENLEVQLRSWTVTRCDNLISVNSLAKFTMNVGYSLAKEKDLIWNIEENDTKRYAAVYSFEINPQIGIISSNIVRFGEVGQCILDAV